MPSERPAQRFRDIRANVTRIRSHTQGLTAERFVRDPMAVDAVERCFERIAEAARKLGDRYDAAYPELDLPSLRQFGSKLRHDYDQIQPLLVWRMIARRLDALDAMAQAELERSGEEES